MLATGGSAIVAKNLVKEIRWKAKQNFSFIVGFSVLLG